MTVRTTRGWFSAGLGAALLVLAAGCNRDKLAEPKARPSWVSRVDVVPLSTKPAFEGNVELLVTLTNKSKYPVVMSRLDEDAQVQLTGVNGGRATLHPLSVGVAKAIMLAPGETVQSSLLFQRLAEPARQLELYGKSSGVANPGQTP